MLMALANPSKKDEAINDVKALHASMEEEIATRMDQFRDIWKWGTERELFAELVFCLLTPQSKARTCWPAVQCLQEEDILLSGSREQVLKMLKGVRFNERKASYIVEARDMFYKDGNLSLRPSLNGFDNCNVAREWLVKNVKGLGYKEASHFLRNIGLGDNLAILDRHVLKNLVILGVIDEIPKSLTKRKYLEIEENMRTFSRREEIPMDHLDLLLWCKETGEIFK